MKKLFLLLTLTLLGPAALAQVGTTLKEGARATSQKAQEVGDEAKAAVSSQPSKSIDKAKAHSHKARAHSHAKNARNAAKDIGR